jgi:hypothetical protein
MRALPDQQIEFEKGFKLVSHCPLHYLVRCLIDSEFGTVLNNLQQSPPLLNTLSHAKWF